MSKKVVLNVQMSGTRDGVPWPAVGSTVELPDDEAQDMLDSGMARPAGDDKNSGSETFLDVPDDPDDARSKFVPETAVHEPAVPVESLPPEDRRPDMSVIGLADDGEIGHGPTNPPEALQVTPANEPVDMVKAAEEPATSTPRTRRASRTPTTTKKAEGPDTSATGRASSTGTGESTSTKSDGKK